MNFLLKTDTNYIINETWKDVIDDLPSVFPTKISIKNNLILFENLNKIFNSVFILSKTKGFHGMSMRDLSKESGFALGSLYAYFSSKDDLLEIMQYSSIDFFKRTYEKIRKENYDTYLDELSHFVDFHLNLSELFSDWFYFNYMEVKTFKEEAKQRAFVHEEYTQKIIESLLKKAKKNNEISSQIDLNLFGMTIKSLIQDFYLKKWKFKSKDINLTKYSKYIHQVIYSLSNHFIG